MVSKGMDGGLGSVSSFLARVISIKCSKRTETKNQHISGSHSAFPMQPVASSVAAAARDCGVVSIQSASQQQQATAAAAESVPSAVAVASIFSPLLLMMIKIATT
jgi:hypothetical protein